MSVSFIYPEFLWLLILIPTVILIGYAALPRTGRKRRIAGIALRTAIMAALIFALAGIQLNLISNKLTTVFLLDVSDSLNPQERERGEDWVRTAISKMRLGDQAAVIVFAEQALVERLATSDPQLGEISSIPILSRTDISSALQLAFALFPGEGSRRIVLLSDGRENMGRAIEQAEYAAASQIDLAYVPLGGSQTGVETYIDALSAPVEARLGQDIELKTIIQSSASLQASLRLFADGALLQTRDIDLLPGRNQITLIVENDPESTDGAFRRFQVQLLPETDSNLQNNTASAYTVIQGPPAILLVEAEAGDSDNLAQALETAQMRITRVNAADMPAALSSLAKFDSIVLVDVPAPDLPPGSMENLELLVRDLGKGLVMVGGPNSYGAGGYLRTPLERTLPVDMDLRDQEIQSNLALVLAVDKSGSMGRCHCANPDLNQSYVPQYSGQAKVDIAKEAVMRAATALGDQDYLGVLAFDSQPRWAVEPTQALDPYDLEQAIVSIQADGQTNLQAGLTAAYQALENVEARRKHIILLTDGWVHTGELHTLAQQMKSRGITLSIVAAGDGSALYLQEVASLGGGQYYPAASSLDVPDFFLKETIQSAGRYIIEGAFYPIQASPSPLLRSLDPQSFPYLLGYNGVSAKKTARLDLITAQGDPLLASWQYGLGRSVAWTSDLKGQWAASWVDWQDFGRFAAQMVAYTVPASHLDGLTFETRLEENKAVLEVLAEKPDGSAWNFLSGSASIVDPQNDTRQVDLEQVAPGHYRLSSEASIPGVYLLRVGLNDGSQSLGQTTMGLVVPYSPEYKSNGLDRYTLESLVGAAGGRELVTPIDSFAHNLTSIQSTHEIWLPLLILAACLFPLEVSLRRLSIQKSDLADMWEKISSHLPLNEKSKTSSEGVLLGSLFAARQRARDRQERSDASAPLTKKSSPQIRGEKFTLSQPKTQQDGEPDTEKPSKDTLSRLREAKKRAKR